MERNEGKGGEGEGEGKEVLSGIQEIKGKWERGRRRKWEGRWEGVSGKK